MISGCPQLGVGCTAEVAVCADHPVFHHVPRGPETGQGCRMLCPVPFRSGDSTLLFFGPISQLSCKVLVKVNKHTEIRVVTYSCVQVHLSRLHWASDQRVNSHQTKLNSPTHSLISGTLTLTVSIEHACQCSWVQALCGEGLYSCVSFNPHDSPTKIKIFSLSSDRWLKLSTPLGLWISIYLWFMNAFQCLFQMVCSSRCSCPPRVLLCFGGGFRVCSRLRN